LVKHAGDIGDIAISSHLREIVEIQTAEYQINYNEELQKAGQPLLKSEQKQEGHT